jgi:hypothetical protein
MLLDDGEFLQVTNNTKELLKLWGIAVISEMNNILKLNEQK